MSEYEIRRGRRTDARTVRTVFNGVLREHKLNRVDVDRLREIVRFGESGPSSDHFVAVSRGAILGFAVAVPLSSRAGELSHVFVERAHRGRGVGTALIARVMKAAETRGYAGMHLSTLNAFAGACGYYERHGWTRGREDAAGSIFFSRPLRNEQRDEVTRPLPPISRTLHGVLTLLDRFTRLRARLERDRVAKPPEPSQRTDDGHMDTKERVEASRVKVRGLASSEARELSAVPLSPPAWGR